MYTSRFITLALMVGVISPVFAKDQLSSILIHIKQGMPYAKARKALLHDGWQTVTMHVRPNGTPVCNEDNQDCKYPEIEACSGSGMGYCKMFFYDGGKTYLELITEGGSPPDAVVNSWTKSKKPPKIEPEESE